MIERIRCPSESSNSHQNDSNDHLKIHSKFDQDVTYEVGLHILNSF